MRSLLFFLSSFLLISFFANAQSPGGISANNTMWLRSDVGLTTVGTTINQWQEVSGANVTGNFTVQSILGTATTQTAPTLVDAGINFNPYVRFDGVTNSLSSINLFTGTSLVTNSNVTVFQVFNLKGGIVWLKWETDQVGATGRIGYENAGGNIRFDFPKAVTASNGENVGNINVLNQHSLSTTYADVAIATSINRLNGANNSTLTLTGGPGDFSGVSDKIVIGNENILDLPAQIDMAEVIIYARTLTAAEINKVESYLAVKYGFTLNQAAVNANDYTASNGTIIWDRSANSVYANNITGIGRDDASNLAQKQSKSINTNGLITIYTNGTYAAGNFPLLNSANANSFTNDGSFILIGDDAAPITIDQCIFNGKGLRMQRIWKASVTATALPATFSVDNGSIPATAKNIIVSTDPTFPPASTILYPLTFANGKIYAAVPLNHNDYFTYATDTLVVNMVPTQPTCTNPNSANVTTTVTGNASPLTYSWSPSGQVTANLANVASGTYTLTITQGICQSTQQVTLTAPGAPTAPLANGVTICQPNATATLTVTTPVAGNTYNWYDAASAGTLLGTGTSYTTATITATITVYVEAVTGSCSSVRTPVIITYGPATAAIVPAVTICPGTTALLTVQNPVAGYTYDWYSDAAHTVLLGTGASYSTPVLNTSTDYYIHTTTTLNCDASSSVTVSINTVTVPVVNNVGLCDVGAATLTVQSPVAGYTYNWYAAATGGSILSTGTSFTSPTLSANTNYYVEAVNGTCLSIRVPVSVTIGEATAPVVNNQIICSGSSTTIAVQNANSAYTYNWYTAASGGSVLATGTSYTTPVLSTATTYYVEAVNGTCNSVRVPVDVGIEVLTAPTSANVSVCSGSSANLAVQNPAAGVTYNWYATAAGGTVLGTGNSYTTNPLYAGATFYVGSTDGLCNSTLTAVVVSLIALDSPRVSTINIGFNNLTFTWLPVAGAAGYQVSVDGGSFIYPSSGSMGLTHTISGLQNSQTVTIIVVALAPPQGCGNSYPGHGVATTYGVGFYVPSAFTPNNGDVINNVLRPKLPGGSVLEYFTVFNRWGQRVFTTNRIGEGWDGKWSGKDQPVGTYVWICKYLFAGRQEVEQKGSFMILH
ncbi:MAG: gliding motility-associated C-terminal domain-containing protein [Ferruginibacter sp.]